MKLKESKEKVPATFVTSYISDAWEKVGYIKGDLEAVKAQYKDTKVVEECLQDIIDAYLIAAGRLQAYLEGSKQVEMPDNEVNEALTEDLDATVAEDVNVDNVNVEIEKAVVAPDAVKHPVFSDDLDTAPAAVFTKSIPAFPAEPAVKPSEADFEYSCDFDTPELSQEELAQMAQIMQFNR